MTFNSRDGLYVFEVVLGFKANGEKQFSTPCLVQADDPEEAEEKVFEYLEGLDLDQDFWIEEMSDPFSLDEYEQRMDESDADPPPVLDELTEEEFSELLGY